MQRALDSARGTMAFAQREAAKETITLDLTCSKGMRLLSALGFGARTII
jgi:hypothetical protein